MIATSQALGSLLGDGQDKGLTSRVGSNLSFAKLLQCFCNYEILQDLREVRGLKHCITCVLVVVRAFISRVSFVVHKKLKQGLGKSQTT
jgi:hypothetical protein